MGRIRVTDQENLHAEAVIENTARVCIVSVGGFPPFDSAGSEWNSQ